ncbi:MAG: hypothetical protein QF441_01845 [Bacteriovoracaceae bacterium]|jgi:hypothetical protein|nr:hypothetical protein [Bacteriovoracaceae bacterium]
MRYLLIITLAMYFFNLDIRSSFAKSYSQRDLNVLVSQKSFYEFFEHAHDIIPSQRSQEWKSQVEQMAQEYLDFLKTKSELKSKQIKLVYEISSWPHLRNNEFFIKKRDFIFLSTLKQCFSAKNKKACLKKVDQIYHDFKHNRVFSFELAILLQKNHIDEKIIWNYIKDLTSHPISEFYCSQDGFKNLVLNKIHELMSSTSKKDLPIHQDCIKSLKTDLSKQLLSSDRIVRSNAFKVLKKHNLLDNQQTTSYHTLSFLAERTQNKQQTNLSLSSLKKLSKNYQLRNKVLAQLKELDPLPGDIFKHNTNKIVEAKTRILSRYFPEFLDHYARTCLDYLSGRKTFNKGNPTPHCHQLFSHNKSVKVLPENFVQEYNKATYFYKK